MTDNLVGVGDRVQLVKCPGGPEILQTYYQVVASQPEDEGHIIVRGWYGESYYNAWHPSRLRTQDGKQVTGFREREVPRAEVVPTDPTRKLIYDFDVVLNGRRLTTVGTNGKGWAQQVANDINRALGHEEGE